MVGKYIHDSKLVNDEFDCHYVNLTTATCLEDVGKGGVRKLWSFYRKLLEIKKAIRQVRPDAVYVTPNSAGGPFYKDFVVVQLCKWCSNKKIILHFHNKGVATRQDRWIDNYLYQRFFRNVEVILLGKPLYEDVRKYVSEEHVHYCPNGIKDNLNVNPNLNVSVKKVPRILWLTNIMRTKGVMEFLDALVLLKERNLAFFVDFVGGITVEITEQQFRQALVARGLDDCTQYAGRKYGEEKEAFFNNADVFALPSYTEAFPLTILEAMQHGLPVVATNVGGVSTAVENGVNGILIGGEKPVMSMDFRPDVKELADALQILLTDRTLRQDMGKAGREKFEREFTLEQFERRLVEVMNDNLNDNVNLNNKL
jgi:glycosyltransferase involved in cell wall biosynthesis